MSYLDFSVIHNLDSKIINVKNTAEYIFMTKMFHDINWLKKLL